MVESDLARLVERLRRHIGREGPPMAKAIEKGALLKFCRAIGETNPLYVDEDYARSTVYGGLIAPPTYLSVFSEACAGVFEKDLPLTRFLHTDDVIESFHPIRVGEVITASPRLADIFLKTGRRGPLLFQAADIPLTNERGDRVAQLRVLMAYHS